MEISIVIPVYNGEKYIEETLNSVLNQKRPADEIIICDNNSTDNTLKICEKYSDKIKICSHDGAPYNIIENWNRAISLTSCDFVSILHADDQLDPDFLEEVEKAHNLYPDVKHIVSICDYIDENGKIFKKSSHNSGEIKHYGQGSYADAYILSPDHINRCPGVVTHKDVLKVCKYREESGHMADDDFFIRVENYTDVVCIHKPLAFYREHVLSATGKMRLYELFYRLMIDTGYQISQFDNNPILSDKVKAKFIQDEKRFIKLCLLHSVRRLKWNYMFKTLSYKHKNRKRTFSIKNQS